MAKSTLTNALAIDLQDTTARITVVTAQLQDLTARKTKLEAALEFVTTNKDDAVSDVLDTLTNVLVK